MRDIHLYALFNPQAIAVIGTFHEINGESSSAADHLIVSNLKNWDYQGTIIPVKWDGLTENTSLVNVPHELAIVCLPPEQVLDALIWSTAQGVRAAIITSAGFREIGGKGYYLEEAILHLAQQKNLTLLGPNCLGIVSWTIGMNASLISQLPGKGSISFFSPSGSMGQAILSWAKNENLGFSKFASLGNRAVIDEASMLQFLADDPDTSVIIGYLEGMNSGRRFARISQTITRQKPVIMLQAGMTTTGRKAISSHVGALTGSEQAYQTALKQAGIILVDNLSSLFDLARIFGTQSLPQGPNVVILTNSGGAGILAADHIAQTRLNLSRLTTDTTAQLNVICPAHTSATNPVDLGMSTTPDQYGRALQYITQDPHVDMVLVVITPGLGINIPAIAEKLVAVSETTNCLIAICLLGQDAMTTEKQFFHHHGLPCYTNPQAALTSMEAMFAYTQWQARPYPVEVCYRRDKAKAEYFLNDCRDTGRTEIFGLEILPLLQAYELQVPQTELARTSRSAVKIAKRITFPVVLKIASPFIKYKRDVDGVESNLHSPEDIRQAFVRLTSQAQRLRSEVFISGCLVQKMIENVGLEICIQVQRDPRFGPLIHFGVPEGPLENLQNFASRLAPLSLDDTASMMREIRLFSRVKQKRGRNSLDFQAVEDVLLTISQLTLDFPEIHTLEFDPILVTPRGAWVAGARLTLDSKD